MRAEREKTELKTGKSAEKGLLEKGKNLFGEDEFFRPRSHTVIAVIFGLVNTAALHLFYRNRLPCFSVRDQLLFFSQAVVLSFLFMLAAKVVIRHLEKIGASFDGCPSGGGKLASWYDRHVGQGAFLIILLGWLPWIISYYPASMDYDVYDSIMKQLGMQPPSDHHPWFYVWVIGKAYRVGVSLGDKNIGIFLYTLVRAIFMAAIYARCAYLQKKNGAPRALYTVTILFFAVTPVWGAYAKHAFKDSIGAALFCWFILTLIEIILQICDGRPRRLSCLEYSAAALLAALFRHNMSYVIVPVTLVLFILMITRKYPAWYSVLLVLGVLLFQVYEGYIFTVLEIPHGNAREALSIPFQQTARTAVFHGEEFTEEEKTVLQAYFPGDALLNYDPIISDPVKNNNSQEYWTMGDYLPYLETWARMLFRFPYTYLEAFIAHSSGYYAFIPDYSEEVRFGPGNYTNVGMTVFSGIKHSEFPEWLQCSYREGTEGARRVMDNWVRIWHRIPILNLTDSKPLYTWVIILMGWLFVRRKEYYKLLPIFACLLMVLTCVASPVNDCFRYFAPVAAAFPGLLILLKPNPENGGIKEEEKCHTMII